ncbi:MAG: hypothetical protein JWO85_1528, partial [Candidatus Eremiobacteraeota bacterium]|nr:hypothetical protein [Candidatus Eremiobacteraeota bacterium]
RARSMVKLFLAVLQIYRLSPGVTPEVSSGV